MTRIEHAIGDILETYVRAQATKPFPGDMGSRFDHLAAAIADLFATEAQSDLEVWTGFGMGEWSRSPWVTILDPRAATTPYQGLRVSLRFPQDLSGVFLTLDQGTGRDITERGRKAARDLWRERAAAIRGAQGAALENIGFQIDDGITLGLDDAAAAEDLKAATVAWRQYDGGSLSAGNADIDDALISLVELYRPLAERYGGRPAFDLDPDELQTMRERFLRHMTGFQSFADPGRYASQERDYKVEMSRAFRADLLPMLSPPVRDEADAVERIAALHHFLTRRKFGDWQQPQNLVGWRMAAHLAALSSAEQQRAATLYQELLAAHGPTAARLERFNAGYIPILRAHMPTGLQSVTRSLPTLLLMLSDPDHEIFIRTSLLEDASRRLMDRRLLSGDPLDAAEYEACLNFALAVRKTLEEWNWKPQDMIDVQGFLWVADPTSYIDPDKDARGCRKLCRVANSISWGRGIHRSR